jgi:DNA polymerase-3 subunit gamma/tau
MSETAYLPYHRKYRPKSLSQYIANDRMKKSLMSALESSHLPQVMLYKGPAGTGKTSLARLTAKEYLCENRNPISGACGKCHSCSEMDIYIETGDADSLMNLREIDVTEDSGKQAISELLEDASIPAYDGGWKIYILDECHMMTNSAQNRLLKNLEEPADRVLMILCTTDPQKLLETILSRCQYVFGVTKPNRDELGNLLARVCKLENVRCDPRALSLVCVKGDFVPRKALVALEQVVREKQDVTYENTVEVLNIIADKYFFDFYTILLSDNIDIFKYITFIGKLKSSTDLKQFIDSLIIFTMRGIYINNGVVVEALDKSEITQYKRLFSQFIVGDVAYLLNLLLSMKSSLDVEARLLLLGYTGLRRQKANAEATIETELVDTSAETVAQERKESDSNYLESITMSDSEKVDFVVERKKTVTADDLAQMFQGTKITTT